MAVVLVLDTHMDSGAGAANSAGISVGMFGLVGVGSPVAEAHTFAEEMYNSVDSVVEEAGAEAVMSRDMNKWVVKGVAVTLSMSLDWNTCVLLRSRASKVVAPVVVEVESVGADDSHNSSLSDSSPLVNVPVPFAVSPLELNCIVSVLHSVDRQ